MAAVAKGTTYSRAGKLFARVTIGPGKRPEFHLPTVATLEAARERTAVLAGLAALLRPKASAEQVKAVLERAALAKGRGVQAVRDAAEAIASGKVTLPEDGPVTVAKLAEQWWRGDLAKRYPDQIKVKRTSDDDRRLFARHILPHIGALAVSDVTLADCERCMVALPPDLARNTRRTVAIALSRLFSLSVYPLKLRAASPLPRGFLPRPGATPAKSFLYPSEDRALMACKAVPLVARLFYGTLIREGFRAGECLAMRWADLDLDRGAVRLDSNKTDDHGRAWALAPGVAPALRAWRELLRAEGRDVGDAARVFATVGKAQRPDELRKALQVAGVTRPELFERTANRLPLRTHDTRGTFVTLALANGRSEAWVTDRTGHKSSAMIATYKRTARTCAELGLGDTAPLDRAIPELAATGPEGQGGPPKSGREASSEASTKPGSEASRSHGKPTKQADWRSGRAVEGSGFEKAASHVATRNHSAYLAPMPVESTTVDAPRGGSLDAVLTANGASVASFAHALATSLDAGNREAARMALGGLLATLAETPKGSPRTGGTCEGAEENEHD